MFADLVEKKGEFELKYTFPNQVAPSLGSWLALACKIDDQYPESRVQSVYFETQNHDSYNEKANSDFFKTKFRVRWYESVSQIAPNDNGEIVLFLEKKMKVGSKRLKNRWTVKACGHDVQTASLSSAYHDQWHEIFSEKEGEVIPHFHPFIQISYRRKRFVDSFTGARLSLDYDIRIEKSNEMLLPPPVKGSLPTAVFEVKGNSDTPPESLHFLTNNYVRKANFSKYETCISYLISNS